MITLGVDAHKRMHVAVAVDEAGHELAEWSGTNSKKGWRSVLAWSESFGPERQWGIEGAWNYGRGMAQHLVTSGETVYEINTRWTALGRRRAKKLDKTDRLDARDDDTAVLDLLCAEREALLVEAGRLRNQLHALLMQVDPEYGVRLPKLDSVAGIKATTNYPLPKADGLQRRRAAGVRRLATRLSLTLLHTGDLAGQIEELAALRFAPLTRLCGISLLTAGTLAGILGPGRRFKTDAQLAAYAGAAPLEASSAGSCSSPTQSRRQPTAQCGALSHRTDASAPLAGGAGVSRSAHRGREDSTRGDARTETVYRPRGLAAVAAVRAVADCVGRTRRRMTTQQKTDRSETAEARLPS